MRDRFGYEDKPLTETALVFVLVLADGAAKLSDLCCILDRRFRVAAERLDVDAKLSQAPHAVVVRADLPVVKNIAALKKRSARMAKVPKRIFLVEEPSHVCISQAYALGATLALPSTIDQSNLLAALADPADPEGASPTGPPQQDNAVEIAATAIGSMFTAVSLGEPIDVIGTKEAGRKIADRITERGLTEWLTTVRHHHEGTYQHGLLVTGVAIDFGLSLRLRRTDLERLYSAAVLFTENERPLKQHTRELLSRANVTSDLTGARPLQFQLEFIVVAEDRVPFGVAIRRARLVRLSADVQNIHWSRRTNAGRRCRRWPLVRARGALIILLP